MDRLPVLLRSWLPFLLGMGLAGCVDLYEPSLTLTANVLIVDGSLTDAPERQTIRLARSRVFGGRSATTPVEGAKVEIVVNGSQVVSLPENRTTRGLYEAPEGFRGRVGSTYQLRFQLTDGQRYESTAEPMPAVPNIGRVYDRFDAAGIANAEKTRFLPANLVYVDTQDPAEQRNYYRWQYTLWELQSWCASCERGIYNLAFNPATNQFSGACQTQVGLPAGNIYDYTCASPCWEIIRGLSINLLADNFSNGKSIAGRLVVAVPYTQPVGALLEIRQQGLTPGAYQYYRLFEQQAQNTGGLADTPPSPIVGNIRNLANEREPVVGYFSGASVSAVRYRLTRQNASGAPTGLYEYLNNRPPNPEPSGPFRPPLAVCVPSETRTPVQPDGWQ